MIENEMNNYERCEFTSQVCEIVATLRDHYLVSFSKAVDFATDALNARPVRDPNENELIDSSRLIYNSVRDLRNAILLIPQPDGDNQFEIEEDFELGANFSLKNSTKIELENTDIDEIDVDNGDDEVDTNQPKLTDEQREKLNAELSSLRKEKTNFDREVLKWDDGSNEIVVLAKQMCVIMMDMIKFTRGLGPLKSTMDIITAAKQITEIGVKLEKLCRKLAAECPESQSKKELLEYLGALPLFCNQLTICTKVQENIIDVTRLKREFCEEFK